jgi:hypothetical protein
MKLSNVYTALRNLYPYQSLDYYNGHIEEDEMSGACSMQKWELHRKL